MSWCIDMGTVGHKFLFEDDFARKDGVLNSQIENMIALAKQEGYGAGLKDGIERTKNEIEVQLSQCFQNLASQMLDVMNAQIQSENFSKQLAAQLAIEISKKFAQIEFEKEPLLQLEKHIQSVFEDLSGEQQVLVLVSPELLSLAEQRLMMFFDQQGFQGRLTIRADETFSSAEAKVQWSRGGFELNPNQILQSAQEVIELWLAHNEGRVK